MNRMLIKTFTKISIKGNKKFKQKQKQTNRMLIKKRYPPKATRSTSELNLYQPNENTDVGKQCLVSEHAFSSLAKQLNKRFA